MGLQAVTGNKWNTKGTAIVLAGTIVAAGIGYALATRSENEGVMVSYPATATSPTSGGIAKNSINACAGVEVISIGVSTDVSRGGALLDASPTITVGPGGGGGKAITIIAAGPVLGSMDSAKVKTDLVCTAKGLALTATITRSADYEGAVLANVHWRPRVTIAVVLRQAEVILQTTWRMRLTTGNELDHARTPPYADQKYPITVTKTLTRN